MSNTSIGDYRRMRKSAVLHLFTLPLMVLVTKTVFESLLTDAPGMAESTVFDTIFSILYLFLGLAIPGAMLVAGYAHVQIATNGGRDSNIETGNDGSNGEDVDVAELLASLNAKLPSLTFGTYRHVAEESPGWNASCSVCDEGADVVRTYHDSTVRFGLAFGATDAESIAYCEECAETEEAVQEGWNPKRVDAVA